jgi:hypothetical protein
MLTTWSGSQTARLALARFRTHTFILTTPHVMYYTFRWALNGVGTLNFHLKHVRNNMASMHHNPTAQYPRHSDVHQPSITSTLRLRTSESLGEVRGEWNLCRRCIDLGEIDVVPISCQHVDKPTACVAFGACPHPNRRSGLKQILLRGVALSC